MKYTEEKLNECVAWVEQNGIYPQNCGASIQSFCRGVGIDDNSYYAWMKKPKFAEAMKKANEVFAQNTIVAVKNALMEKALGCKREKSKLTEEGYIDNGKMKTKKAVRVTDTIEYPPDTGACIFVITNLDPENWKNKKFEELGGSVDVIKPNIVFRDDSDGSDGEE